MTLSKVFFIVAAFLFLIATLVAAHAISGNVQWFLPAGLVALAAGLAVALHTTHFT